MLSKDLPIELLLLDADIMAFDPKSKHHQLCSGYSLGISATGKIVFLGRERPEARNYFSLAGKTILPGVIDTQVHFREPGLMHKEDLQSGSLSSLLGGVTSYFEMPNTIPATTSANAHQDKLKRAQGRSHAHFAFYIGGCAENAGALQDLESLAGCPGVKTFIGSSTGTLLVDQDEVLESLFQSGKKRLVFHSEDEARLRSRRHLIEGASPSVALHPEWRDVESALIATKKLSALAIKYRRPIHVLHISSAEEVHFLREQKKLHPELFSFEILPQHLTFAAPDCYSRLGTKAQQNPPIREKRHQEELWRAVQDGSVDLLGSDHAPHTLQEKALPYPKSPSGMPMAQTFLPILLNHVHQKRLSLERLVELVCENPRQLFGLKKGRLALGEDADLTVVDLERQVTLKNEMMVSKSGWTPFDGVQITGYPTSVFLMGKLAMHEAHYGQDLVQAVPKLPQELLATHPSGVALQFA